MTVLLGCLGIGYDMRTAQELLWCKDVSTTVINTHVLNKGGKGYLLRSQLLGDFGPSERGVGGIYKANGTQ